MKISLWTRYSQLGASSRLRFFQFIPALCDRGFDVECSSFFDDSYLRELYSGKKRNFFKLTKFYSKRFAQMKHTQPGIPAVIEYELLPHMPYFFEKKFLDNHPYILNFDDAVDLHYTGIPFLKNKYPRLIANAKGVIVANDVLAERFSEYNENILKLPTIPPECIKPGKKKPEKLTLVWTGTPVTYQFLYERRRALQLAAQQTDFELLIVGGKESLVLEGVSCRYISWSEQNESAALAGAHAGLMPLPDTAFARGKSAYKLICYLRAGIPGIASPVGENCKVIQDGENGFLVESDSQWCQAVKALADRKTRQEMSRRAADAGKNFLLDAAGEKLAGFISKTLA